MEGKFTRNIGFQDGATITVEMENYPLAVRPSETNELKINVEVALSNPDQMKKMQDAAMESKGDLVKALFEVSGESTSNVTIEVNEDEFEQFIEKGWNKNFRFIVELPVGCPLVAESENGVLDVQDLTQMITLTNENGPTRVKSCSGVLTVDAENGPIDIADYSGNITVRMENGPVKVSGSKGTTLNIEIENGPVTSRDNIYQDVSIRGENGPVKIDIPKDITGTYTLETENGAIRVSLASESRYDITAENEVGAIVLQLSETCTILENEQEECSKHIHVVEGEGGIKLNIRSETGMIKVKEESTGEKELKIEISGVPNDFEEGISHLTTLVTNLSNQISHSVSMALGKAVKKINVPDNDRKLDMERVTDKIQRMGDKIQRAVNPDFEVPEPPEPPEVEENKGKLKILELLEKGKITAEEATVLLKAMQSK